MYLKFKLILPNEINPPYIYMNPIKFNKEHLITKELLTIAITINNHNKDKVHTYLFIQIAGFYYVVYIHNSSISIIIAHKSMI